MGLGGTLLDWFDIVKKLAAADPSVGWCVAHGAMTSSILYSIANDAFRDHFFQDIRNTASWSNLSRVNVDTSRESIRVSGSWSFVTGCTNATYAGGTIRMPVDGRDRVVSVLLPASSIEIQETWDPVGLAGSGSHTVVVDQVTVPEDNIFIWPRPWKKTEDSVSDKTVQVRALNALVAGTLPISLCCAATQLGIACGALQALDGQLQGKKDAFSGIAVFQRPHILTDVEQAHGELIVLEAAFTQMLTQIWDAATCNGDLPESLRLATRLGCVTIVERCRDLVHKVFDTSGAAALSRENLMQKFFRDASCLTSHVSVNRSSYETTSKVRYKQDKPSWL